MLGGAPHDMDRRFYLPAPLPRSAAAIPYNFWEGDRMPSERPYSGDERRLHHIGEESRSYERLEMSVDVRYRHSQPPGHPDCVPRQHPHPPPPSAHFLSDENTRTSQPVQTHGVYRNSTTAVQLVEHSHGLRQYPQSVTEGASVMTRPQNGPPYQVPGNRRYPQVDYDHRSRQHHNDQAVIQMNYDYGQRQRHATIPLIERTERIPQYRPTEQFVYGDKGCPSQTPVDYNHGPRQHRQAVQVDYYHQQHPVATSTVGPYYENLTPPAAENNLSPSSDFSPGQLTDHQYPHQYVGNHSGNYPSASQRAHVTATKPSATFSNREVSGVVSSRSRQEQNCQQTSTQQVMYRNHPARSIPNGQQNKDSSSLMSRNTSCIQNGQQSNSLLLGLLQRDSFCDVTSDLPHQTKATAAESIAGRIRENGGAYLVAEQGGNPEPWSSSRACAISVPSTTSCALPNQQPHAMVAPFRSVSTTERPSSLTQQDLTSQCYSSVALHDEPSCGQIRSSASHLVGTDKAPLAMTPDPIGSPVSMLNQQPPIPPHQLTPPSSYSVLNSHPMQSVLRSARTTAAMSVGNTTNSESSCARSKINTENRQYPRGQLSAVTVQPDISAWLLSKSPGHNRREALSHLTKYMIQIVKKFQADKAADPTNKQIPAYQNKVFEQLMQGAFAIETAFSKNIAIAMITHIYNIVFFGATSVSELNYSANNSETLNDPVSITKNRNDSVSCTLTCGSDNPAAENGSEHQIVWKRQFGTLKDIKSNVSTPVYVNSDSEIDDDVIIIENVVDNDSSTNADENVDFYHICMSCKRKFDNTEELDVHIDEHLYDEDSLELIENSSECPAAVRIEQRATDTVCEPQVEQFSVKSHCARAEDVQGNSIVPSNSRNDMAVEDPETDAAFDPSIFHVPPGSDTVLAIQHDGADTVISLNDSTSFVDQASLPVKIKQALASGTVKVEFDLPNCPGWTVEEKMQVARLVSNCLEEVEQQKKNKVVVTQNDEKRQSPERQLDDCGQESLELQEQCKKVTEAARSRNQNSTTGSQSIPDRRVDKPVEHCKSGKKDHPHSSIPCPVVTTFEKAPRIGISNEQSAANLSKLKPAKVLETSQSEPPEHQNLFEKISSSEGVSSVQHTTAQRDREREPEGTQKGSGKTRPIIAYEQAKQNSGNLDYDARSTTVDGKTNSSVTSDEHAWDTSVKDVQRGEESVLQRVDSSCARRNRNSDDNKNSEATDSSSIDPCTDEFIMLSNGQTFRTKEKLSATSQEVCKENVSSVVPAVGILPESGGIKTPHIKPFEICYSENFKKNKCNKLEMSPRVVLMKENIVCGLKTKAVKECDMKTRFHNDQETTVEHIENVKIPFHCVLDNSKHNEMESGKDEKDLQNSSRDDSDLGFDICEQCGTIFTDKQEYDRHSCFAESSSEDEVVNEAKDEVNGDENDSSLAVRLTLFPWKEKIRLFTNDSRPNNKPSTDDDKRPSSSTKHSSESHNSSVFLDSSLSNASSSKTSQRKSPPGENIVFNLKTQTKSSTSKQNKDSVLSKNNKASDTTFRKQSSITSEHQHEHSDSSVSIVHPSEKAESLSKKYKDLSSSSTSSSSSNRSASSNPLVSPTNPLPDRKNASDSSSSPKKSNALNHGERHWHRHPSSQPKTKSSASHKKEDRSTEPPKKYHLASVKHQSPNRKEMISSSKQCTHLKESSKHQRGPSSSRNEKTSTQEKESVTKKVKNNAPSQSNASTRHVSHSDPKKCPKKRPADAMSSSHRNLWNDEDNFFIRLPTITSKRHKAQ